MQLLTDSAQIYVGNVRRTFRLYKAGSAENHATSDDVTLKQALIAGLNASVGPNKIDQGNGVFRVRINDGIGYLVYKLGVDGQDSAAIFHYHWNYNLDLPLNVA